MRRFRLKCVNAAAIFVLTAAVSSANDIEDFLQALRGPERSESREFHPRPVASRYDRPTARFDGHRDDNAVSPYGQHPVARHPIVRHRDYQPHPGVDAHEVYDLRQSNFRHRAPRYPLPVRREVGYRLSFDGNYADTVDDDAYLNDAPSDDGSYPIPLPPVPQPPLPVYRAPLPSIADHGGHEIGDIVQCPVPLEPCVRIEDAENMAPDACPIVVAVRDPHAFHRHHGCAERVAYVEVCVPPCPPDRITVSACRTRVRLEFGDYEVTIRSQRGWIVVDYDN